MKNGRGRRMFNYIGNKARWAPRLERFRGERFVEPFAGSAALSFELAGAAFWNERDPCLAWILSSYDQQEVPEVFTVADYDSVRYRPDWWRWSFCLQKLAFASEFRHGSANFAVPPDRRRPPRRFRWEYEENLARWRELAPEVRCGDWADVSWERYKGAVVVFDPPYGGSVVAYGHSKPMDVERYWRTVDAVSCLAKATLVFDFEATLRDRFPGVELQTRAMRPVGDRAKNVEAMAVLE